MKKGLLLFMLLLTSLATYAYDCLSPEKVDS
jgi:hypothetical protein